MPAGRLVAMQPRTQSLRPPLEMVVSAEKVRIPPVAAIKPNDEPRIWRVIWLVGGAVWLAVTCVSLIWLLPWSGSHFNGEYVPSTAAKALKDALVFLAAVLSYRGVIALGWPHSPAQRLRVLMINALLVLGLLLWSELLEACVTGLIDGQYAEMQTKFHTIFGMFWRLGWLASLVRGYVIEYALGLCAVVLALLIERRHREALEAAELARAYAVARMAMLAAQLQPHFLFNSLNALTELIEDDPKRASAMVVRLASFLRYALQVGTTPWVDMATEIAGLETYLDVQRVRFANGIRTSVAVSPEVTGFYVPTLILQALVENAIVHGRTTVAAPLVVSVGVALVGGRLKFAIRNSRPTLRAPLSSAAYGRGLSNVALRLRAAYGADAHLEVKPHPEGGTLAELDLPVRTAPPGHAAR